MRKPGTFTSQNFLQEKDLAAVRWLIPALDQTTMGYPTTKPWGVAVSFDEWERIRAKVPTAAAIFVLNDAPCTTSSDGTMMLKFDICSVCKRYFKKKTSGGRGKVNVCYNCFVTVLMPNYFMEEGKERHQVEKEVEEFITVLSGSK
jgi:hypothetical protein